MAGYNTQSISPTPTVSFDSRLLKCSLHYEIYLFASQYYNLPAYNLQMVIQVIPRYLHLGLQLVCENLAINER
jgi:hypothetical protein